MHRGWQDDPLFKGEPYSRRDAWEWLIANAAYEQHFQWFNGHRHNVERGQIVLSLASAAKAWKWTVQRVRTFFDQLETDEKVTRQATRSVTQLTVCNYEKYQAKQHSEEPDEQQEVNTGATQEQHTTEEEKETKKGKKKEEESASFAFFGRTIKLKARDLQAWRTRYHVIPDLEVELYSLDAWFETQDDKARKEWFWRTQSSLGRKHNEILERRQKRDDGYDPNVITV